MGREPSKRAAVDSTTMRQSNAALVLQLIWNAGQLSRADLSRETGLSASTVSDITNELRDLGLIDEQGRGDSSGGRRPILLGVREDRIQIIGAEIGATHLTVTALSFCGRVLCSRREDCATRDRPQETLERFFELVEWCFEQPGIDRRALLGIGVAVPCPVDPAEPGRLSRRILPAWAEIDLHETLTDRYECPVFVENDANAGALAEQWFGEHDDAQNLAYVKVATGVGAGFVIDGRLYRGSGGTAGEIGHLSVDPQGRECSCGGRGCLTTVIGTQAILEHARDSVRTRTGEELTSIHDLIHTTLDGDRAALELVEFVGEHLGMALAGLLNLINPQVVVLGGEIMDLQDLLVDPLRISMRRQALFGSVARTRIVTSRLGTQAIAVGAGVLVLSAALRDLSLFPALRTSGAA